MSKKNSMFYTGSGRGDHSRIMMTASSLCVDEVSQAREIDSYFNDVRAYIASIEPPRYPNDVDATLVAQGEEIFEMTCSVCHGSYGVQPTYPNIVIHVDDVGTDPVLATGYMGETPDRFVNWFNNSFWGEEARLDPQMGYVPPPLDGIWATAPFLHNGSVPNLETLLDSSKRPQYWTRTYTHDDYDLENVGWNYTELDYGHDQEPNQMRRVRIYDTTLVGYGNQGHTYGDILEDTERRALIEYLKTL